MRMFKNQNQGKSELFGDKVERVADEASTPSWLENFARKQTGSEHVSDDNSTLLRNRLLGSHSKDAGGHIGSLSVKSASDTIFGQKDPPAPKAANTKKTDDAPEDKPEPLPTSAERLAMHVTSTSGKAAGRGLIRKDSVSLFDKDPFSHIEDRKLAQRTVAPREAVRPTSPIASRSLAEGLFDKLSASHAPHQISSSDVGAVERMFNALKGGGEK
jgi:hypothetical protein